MRCVGDRSNIGSQAGAKGRPPAPTLLLAGLGPAFGGAHAAPHAIEARTEGRSQGEATGACGLTPQRGAACTQSRSMLFDAEHPAADHVTRCARQQMFASCELASPRLIPFLMLARTGLCRSQRRTGVPRPLPRQQPGAGLLGRGQRAAARRIRRRQRRRHQQVRQETGAQRRAGPPAAGRHADAPDGPGTGVCDLHRFVTSRKVAQCQLTRDGFEEASADIDEQSTLAQLHA